MPRQASIRDLPPSLLELCWAPLGLCERHRTIPLVCSSWRQQLNSSPQLLRAVNMQFVQQRSTTRLRSFSEWMLRWGASRVQQLDLDVQVAMENNAEAVAEELASILSATLCACGTGGALRELRLQHGLSTKNTAWLPALRQLRLLHLTAEDTDGYMELEVEFDPPAWAVAGLQNLYLAAYEVLIPPTAHLPTSLTRLRLRGLQNDDLPPQFTRLVALQDLCLEYSSVSAGGYAPLAALTGLRRLVLDCCPCLPASLPQLTQLEALAVVDDQGLLWDDDDQHVSVNILQTALPALEGQLTLLALPDSLVGPPPLAPPSLLTASSRLQALFVLANCNTYIETLPPGPAFQNMRVLTGPLGLLVPSLGALQAASQLEFVGAVCFSPDLASLHILLRWAAQHPTLRHLALEERDQELNSHFHRISDAQRYNPNLRITRHHRMVLLSDHSRLLAECGFDPFYNHPSF